MTTRETGHVKGKEKETFKARESPSFPNCLLSDKCQDDNDDQTDMVLACHRTYSLAGGAENKQPTLLESHVHYTRCVDKDSHL